MPTVKNEKGEVISRQPYTPEGESRAEDIASSNLNWEVEYAPGGSLDGSMRSEQMYAGGGKVGYDSIGMYDKGGKVKDISSKKKDEYYSGKKAQKMKKQSTTDDIWLDDLKKLKLTPEMKDRIKGVLGVYPKVGQLLESRPDVSRAVTKVVAKAGAAKAGKAGKAAGKAAAKEKKKKK